MCVCNQHTFLQLTLIVKSQQNKNELVTRPAYEQLRPLSYPNTDIFILCFSIENPNSFQNILNKWYPEVRHHCPKIPLILVGTKVDMRHDDEIVNTLRQKGEKVICYQQGLGLAGNIGAKKYIECSALTQTGLSHVFETAVRAVKTPEPEIVPWYRRCNLL